MIDPTIQGMLMAFRGGDRAAQPALVDYLLERGHERTAALIRKASTYGDLLQWLEPFDYVQELGRRLEAAGHHPFLVAGDRACYIVDGPFTQSIVVFARLAVLDRTGFQRLARESRELAADAVLSPQLSRISRLPRCCFVVAVVPRIDTGLASQLRRSKPSYCWNRSAWSGWLVPVVYEGLTGQLYHFQRPRWLVGNRISRYCLGSIDCWLRPRWRVM